MFNILISDIMQIITYTHVFIYSPCNFGLKVTYTLIQVKN